MNYQSNIFIKYCSSKHIFLIILSQTSIKISRNNINNKKFNNLKKYKKIKNIYNLDLKINLHEK